MAPVIKALQQSSWANCRVLVTAQHRELLDHMLEFFDISADLDLDIMTNDQTLPELTARLISKLDHVLAQENPDIVLAQGDTTTVFTTALAAFYRNIPFGHVEAGLRTHNLNFPYPEEANRVLTGHLSSLHFAPTQTACDNLLREGIKKEAIHLTGNTVIDALFMARERKAPIGVPLDPDKRLVLVTAHRRDSFGEPIRDICEAIMTLCRCYDDIEILWPVHPNPSVKSVVQDCMDENCRIHLIDPLPYGPFVSAMQQAYLILTDSGGIQEEAPALGKPVLVLREESERPEAIEAGVARLVGRNKNRIVEEAGRLLKNKNAYQRMAVGASPYGDGNAGGRIVNKIREYLLV